ncbi:MAG: hypothetical protein ACM3X7_13280 [Solirubrobacterales bacterium]
MKKYLMFIFTIIMAFITCYAFIYENSFKVQQFKQPSISIDSKKYGNIKKIVLLPSAMSFDNALLVLSSKNTSQGEISSLYRVNWDSGEYNLLSEFPSHKNLNNEIVFESPFNSNKIITAYNKGIMKISYNSQDPSYINAEQIEIEGFDTATSMDCKGSLKYTRENDNLLYSQKIYNSGFSMQPENNNEQSFFVKPISIVNINGFRNIISYLSPDKGEANLYTINSGSPLNNFGLPVVKNVVSAHGMNDTQGFAGFNFKNDISGRNNLNLFMVRYGTNINSGYTCCDLDTLPNNTDIFGAVPAIDSIGYNNDYSFAYTSFDANHKGVLKLCSTNEKPKVIVQNENIFGPVSISEVNKPDSHSTYVLFFTNENNSTRVKLCNEKGGNVKDITDIFN